MNIVEELKSQMPCRKVKYEILNNESYKKRLYHESNFLQGTQYDNFQDRYICLYYGITEDNFKCPFCGEIRKVTKRKVLQTCGSERCEKERFSRTMKCRHQNMTPEEKNKIAEKMKDTCLEKYGVKYSTQASQMKERTKKTKKERYGDENYNNRGKAKETNFQKYGVASPLQTEEIKNKMAETNLIRYGVRNVFQNEGIKKKIKQTNNEKYGVDYPMQSVDIQKKVDYKSACKKQYETKCKNHTLHASSHEDIIFQYLKEEFGEVKKQYCDERYKSEGKAPYRCDFYLPKEDLFIEYQGIYYHGKEPYDANKHREIYDYIVKKSQELPQLRSKNNYLNYLYIWTIKDVEKRNVAKKNNLKFLEIWSNHGECPSKDFIINEIYRTLSSFSEPRQEEAGTRAYN